MTNDLSLVYNVSLVSLLTAIMSADGDLQRSNMARVATRDGFLCFCHQDQSGNLEH